MTQSYSDILMEAKEFVMAAYEFSLKGKINDETRECTLHGRWDLQGFTVKVRLNEGFCEEVSHTATIIESNTSLLPLGHRMTVTRRMHHVWVD